MKYVIICSNCKKSFAIDDTRFTVLIERIEGLVGDMTDVLNDNHIRSSYKSHNHIFPILETLVRCCAVPSIDLYEIEEDAWNVLYEGADNYFSGDNNG